MKSYGTVQGAMPPEPLVIDDYSVWKNSNIREITVTDPMTEEERTEYQYEVTQYTKDEFIMQHAADITEAQIAMCELYEMIAK